MGYRISNTDIQVQVPTVIINGTKITKVTPGGVNLYPGLVSGFTSDETVIRKVIGYRIII